MPQKFFCLFFQGIQYSKSFHKENPQKVINSNLNSRAPEKGAEISQRQQIEPFPGKVIWDHRSFPSANFSAGLTTPTFWSNASDSEREVK